MLLLYCVVLDRVLYHHLNAATSTADGEGEDLGVHLKLLSLLENPAVIVAAAASGDIATLKDYLSKHPRDVCTNTNNINVHIHVHSCTCNSVIAHTEMSQVSTHGRLNITQIRPA